MRLIDADALDQDVLRYASRKHFHGNIEEASIILKTRQVISAAPTIDAVEVVRCRDCKHYQPEPMGSVLYCYQNRRWTEPDFYCADGEKMDAEVEG